MSLVNFLKSDLVKNKVLKLIGKDYSVAGIFLYADEDFVVLKGKDGRLHGIRIALVDVINTSGDLSPEISDKDTAGDVSFGDTDNDTDFSSEEQAGAGVEDQNDSRPRGFKEFKPGDRIPLEELAQRDPKVANTWKRKERKQFLNEELSERLDAVMNEVREAGRAEDAYSLVAFGKIIELQPGFLFGFIDDLKDGNRYYFNKSDIVDPKLLEVSGKDIPVVYYRGQNHKGYAAKSIMLPSSVTDSLELSAKLLKEGEFYASRQIVTAVLDMYPENTSALNFRNAFINNNNRKGGRNEDLDKNRAEDEYESPEMFRFYKEGKKLMTQKDYRGAIQSYQTALDNGFRKEACIKEIAQCYIGLHSKTEDPAEKKKIAKEGIEFMDEYRAQLRDNLSTLFTLENFYFALGDYERHIDIIEDVIAECGQNNDIPQYTFYLNKAAQSYMHLGEYDKAMDAVMDGLEADPEYPQLQKTQFILMEAMNKLTPEA